MDSERATARYVLDIPILTYNFAPGNWRIVAQDGERVTVENEAGQRINNLLAELLTEVLQEREVG